MMTEIDKSEKTLEWLNFLDLIRLDVNRFALNAEQFNYILKSRIDEYRRICNDTINPPIEVAVTKRKKR